MRLNFDSERFNKYVGGWSYIKSLDNAEGIAPQFPLDGSESSNFQCKVEPKIDNWKLDAMNPECIPITNQAIGLIVIMKY